MISVARICIPAMAFVLLTGTVRAQEVDLSGTRVFLAAQWVFPQKEFGTFWKDGPALGIVADLPLGAPVFLSGLVIASWHGPAETPRKHKIPQVLLLQLGGGMAIRSDLSPSLAGSVSAHLVNNMFVMTGPAVRPGIENAVESEFGISLCAAVSFASPPFPPVSVTGSYQPILVGPEPVSIVSIGFLVGLR